MRLLLLIPLLAAAAAATTTGLAACTTDGERAMGSYATEVDKLRAACEARNGVLQPTGRMSGNPAVDNPCRIREATAIEPR